MTDKIIINNIDVSGCGFYHKETGEDCHIALAFSNEYVDDNHTYFKCSQNLNCYYKQLQREKQKAKELEEELQIKENILDDFMIGSGNIVKQLNNRNNKYKQALEEIKEMIEVCIEQTKIYPLKTNLEKILQKCEVLEECEQN